ncbi:MAG: hypothetical protein U0W24_05895 [Bacteroidales bacterium]
MKLSLYFIPLLMICITPALAQEEVEEKVLKIRADFNEIQSLVKDAEKKTFKYPDKNFVITFEACYASTDRLIKLVAVYKDNDAERKFEYYCKFNCVFFIFLQEKYSDGMQTEKRIYFGDNHQVIRALLKEKKPGDPQNFSQIKSKEFISPLKELKYIKGYDFYGDEMFSKYFSFPAFETVTGDDQKIKKIREEYNKIEALRKSNALNELTADYIDSVAYWNNTRYKGSFDEAGNLVFLTYSAGEEGYSSEVQIYFKDHKPFFTFTVSTDPEGNLEEERVYLYNDQLVKVLEKRKSAEDNREISEIESMENGEMMKDIKNSSLNILNGIAVELNRYLSALDLP